MHRTPRPALALTVALLLGGGLGAGCSTPIAGTPAPAAAAPAAPGAPPAQETDAVAWIDEVCGSLLPFIRSQSTPPALDAGDPAAVVEGLSDYLGAAEQSVDGAISGMAAAGPSPVDGGDQAVGALTTALNTFRSSIRAAKSRTDAIDTSDPRAILRELPGVVEPLQELADLPNPMAGLEESPELDAAAKQAPQCQQIDAEVN